MKFLLSSLLFTGLFAFASPCISVAQSVRVKVVNTSEGPVVGLQSRNVLFLPNVPYAKPPINSLRWKAPRQAELRSGLWDGRKLNVKCAQVGNFFSGISNENQLGKALGSEDCLYLNIWIPSQTDNKKMPVFVWIHGGSNRQGYASDPMYNGANLAESLGAIVVNINYRLGYFGAFLHDSLSTKDAKDSSGNFVTLDIIQALKWVRKHAAGWGADTGNVTLAGQSAGCVNVWGLMLSPLAKDLFQKAYCASGIPNSYTPSMAKSASQDMLLQSLVLKGKAIDEKEAKIIANRMSDRQIKLFLYSLSTEDILSLKLDFVPIQHISDGHVLPTSGLSAINLGQFNAVPMLVTSTKDEGSYFFLGPYSKITDKELWQVVTEKKPPDAIHDLLNSDRYLEFQMKGQRFSYGFTEFIDSTLASGVSNPRRIYRLVWEWEPPATPWKETLGASHGVDLPFVFGRQSAGKNHFFTFLNKHLAQKNVQSLSQSFMTYLKGFVHSGDPNVYAGKLPEWSPWTLALPTNMLISNQGISSRLRYFNPITGGYALMQSLKELYDLLGERRWFEPLDNVAPLQPDNSPVQPSFLSYE